MRVQQVFHKKVGHITRAGPLKCNLWTYLLDPKQRYQTNVNSNANNSGIEFILQQEKAATTPTTAKATIGGAQELQLKDLLKTGLTCRSLHSTLFSRLSRHAQRLAPRHDEVLQ